MIPEERCANPGLALTWREALFSGAILINLESLALTLMRVRLASTARLWRSWLFASRAVVVHLESFALNIPPMRLLVRWGGAVFFEFFVHCIFLSMDSLRAFSETRRL